MCQTCRLDSSDGTHRAVPIRCHANIPLLLHNGMLDALIPRPDAEQLHAAASLPKEVRWYDAGHRLTPQAGDDRYAWLHQHIGIDP